MRYAYAGGEPLDQVRRDVTSSRHLEEEEHALLQTIRRPLAHTQAVSYLYTSAKLNKISAHLEGTVCETKT